MAAWWPGRLLQTSLCMYGPSYLSSLKLEKGGLQIAWTQGPIAHMLVAKDDSLSVRWLTSIDGVKSMVLGPPKAIFFIIMNMYTHGMQALDA